MSVESRPLVTLHVDLADEWRGGQRQVYLLATGLADRGHPTHVATRPGTPLARRLAGTPVRVHEMACRGEWDLAAARRLAGLARENRVELVAAHASHPHGLAVWARWFGMRAPLVVHRRVDFPVRAHFFNRGKYAAPAAYIAISEAVKAILVQGGVPAAKIAVISSGVPAFAAVPGAREKLAAEFGLDPALPWVGDVASLVDHKGHAHLLAAWSRLRRDGIRAELILIGDGPLGESLRLQAERLGIAGAVHWLGWREDVPAWLSALDVFVMTSVTEGLCTAILDAMAARIPVVATAAGGIPELVRDGQTGLLAPVGDDATIAERLRFALREGESAKAMAERAFREVWQPRSAATMVGQTEEFYCRLTQDSNSNTLN